MKAWKTDGLFTRPRQMKVVWDDFKKTFKNKFYPRSICDTKRSKFLNFVQDDMNIAKYEKVY